MGLLAWNDSYSVNVKEIDEQHKKLVNMLNELQDAMKARKGKEAMTFILNGLVDYTSVHFATEEKYFDKFKYSDALNHKKEHQAFVKKVLDFKKKFDEGTLMLTIEVMNFLNEWLIKHIKGSDQKYTKLFNDKGLS